MEVSKTTAFVIIFIASATVCQNHINHQRWIQHNARVSTFKCRFPQPRSVDIREFFGEDIINSVKSILPASTILHRCGSSGCCPMNKTCVSVHTEEVKLVFLVREGSKKKHEYVEVTAQNHTSCACHHHANKPK